MKHTARCSCGQLSISTPNAITRTSICHCHECQRRTGSVFGVQTRFERASAAITGQSTKYRRTGDDPADGHVEFHFCPKCGSTVFWELSGMPDVYAVAVGMFADRAIPAPVFSVYEARMHPWVRLPDSVETHWD
jgi:hypothetical protein